MSVRALATLAVGVGLGLPACSGVDGVAHAGFTYTQLSGDVGLAAGGGGAPVTSTSDVEGELGLDEAGSPYVRVQAAAGVADIAVSGFVHSSNGEGTLVNPFGSINPGPVSSDTDIIQVKAAVTFDLLQLGEKEQPLRRPPLSITRGPGTESAGPWSVPPRRETEPEYVFTLAPGLALDYFDIDMQVRELGGIQEENFDIQAPVPMLYLQARLDLGRVVATVEGGGMSIDAGDGDGTYWDLDAMLRVRPTDAVELFGGYRFIVIDAKGDATGQRFDSDLELSGWTVGFGLHF